MRPSNDQLTLLCQAVTGADDHSEAGGLGPQGWCSHAVGRVLLKTVPAELVDRMMTRPHSEAEVPFSGKRGHQDVADMDEVAERLLKKRVMAAMPGTHAHLSSVHATLPPPSSPPGASAAAAEASVQPARLGSSCLAAKHAVLQHAPAKACADADMGMGTQPLEQPACGTPSAASLLPTHPSEGANQQLAATAVAAGLMETGASPEQQPQLNEPRGTLRSSSNSSVPTANAGPGKHPANASGIARHSPQTSASTNGHAGHAPHMKREANSTDSGVQAPAACSAEGGGMPLAAAATAAAALTAEGEGEGVGVSRREQQLPGSARCQPAGLGAQAAGVAAMQADAEVQHAEQVR